MSGCVLGSIWGRVSDGRTHVAQLCRTFLSLVLKHPAASNLHPVLVITTTHTHTHTHTHTRCRWSDRQLYVAVSEDELRVLPPIKTEWHWCSSVLTEITHTHTHTHTHTIYVCSEHTHTEFMYAVNTHTDSDGLSCSTVSWMQPEVLSWMTNVYQRADNTEDTHTHTHTHTHTATTSYTL